MLRLLNVVLALVVPLHLPTQVRVAEPAEGARVVGSSVRVVLVGEGGNAAAAVRLDLDGRPVDATGQVGGLFSTLSVLPRQQLALTVPVRPGAHTLTVVPNRDTDSTSPTVVRRFTVAAEEKGSGGAVAALAVAVAVVAVVAAVVVRRRASAAGAARPADRPAGDPAVP